MKILVADDSGTMRSLISRVLKNLGFEDAVMCDSGEKALDILGKQKIDLVLLDWHMPWISGLDCLKQIRSKKNTKSIPVVMVTVEQERENVEEAIRSGADEYMIKPLNPDLLKTKINNVAEKYGIEIPESLKSEKEPEQPEVESTAAEQEVRKTSAEKESKETSEPMPDTAEAKKGESSEIEA